jgi:hypothetical protein
MTHLIKGLLKLDSTLDANRESVHTNAILDVPDISNMVDGLVVVVSIGSQHDSELLHHLYEQVKKAQLEGIHPVVAVTFIDTVSSVDDIQQGVKVIQECLRLQPSDVIPIANYTTSQTRRDPNIDSGYRRVLARVLEMNMNKARARHTRLLQYENVVNSMNNIHLSSPNHNNNNHHHHYAQNNATTISYPSYVSSPSADFVKMFPHIVATTPEKKPAPTVTTTTPPISPSAKFCVECGAPFQTATQKFCAECGKPR